MPKRTFLLLSVPENFADKLLGFIHNLNVLNSDREPPIRLEGWYQEEENPATDDGKEKEDYVAIPKAGETTDAEQSDHQLKSSG